jgi:hypothetical protein
MVQEINSRFSELLQTGGNEDQGQDQEGGDPAQDPGTGETFADKWGWVANVDAASETCRCSWDEVLRWTAIEFLNILSYRKDKIDKEKKDIEEWKRTH